ncbi:MAG TPA: nitrilase-related carbon-nitrogen hydrolase [Terracidiphilus sp.]|jgi:apolipoprotein N-acyltransferase
MEFGSAIRGVVIGIAACAAAAALLYFGNGLTPQWPLMWFAPLPLLLFALQRPTWQAALVTAGGWMAGGLALWGYLRALGAPPVAWFADFGMGAVVLVAAVLLMRALVRRGAVWIAWLTLPAVWVTFEFVRAVWLWPYGSSACIAYSQLNFLPFLQLASLAGPWGMGFVLLLFPAGLALGIHLWGSARTLAMQVVCATLGVVGAILIFGAVRLAIPQPGPVVKVGLVASDTVEGIAHSGAATERLFEEYSQSAQELIARGAQVVVLPENVGVVIDPDMARTDAIFQAVADRTGATIVAGMTHIEPTAHYNQARIYVPGEAVRSYNKEHLLPPFETGNYKPGTTRTLFEASGGAAAQTWSVAICKDLDFSEPARAYGQARVGLMLTPAWDFRVDGFWHGHAAAMRAVEDGFSLVRPARRGLLTVTDDRGRIVAETPSNAAPFATLLTTVPAGHSRTLFLLLGDWFGWCSMALSVLAVAQYFGASIQRAKEAPTDSGEVRDVG